MSELKEEMNEIQKCDEEIAEKLVDLHEMESQRTKSPFTAANKVRNYPNIRANSLQIHFFSLLPADDLFRAIVLQSRCPAVWAATEKDRNVSNNHHRPIATACEREDLGSNRQQPRPSYNSSLKLLATPNPGQIAPCPADAALTSLFRSK